MGFRATFAAALVGLCAASPSCAPDDDVATLRVLAASSLTGAFTELEERFERANRDVDVVLAFDGSAQLVTQLLAGAPADVLATADQATYERAHDGGAVDAGAIFATNELEIVVARDDDRIRLLRDLARTDVLVVLCAPEVPCGRLADEMLDRADIPVRAASREPNVQAVVAKVALGEADAGIAYSTDVLHAGADVRGIRIPDAQNVSTSYPIGVATESGARALADRWVAFVRSATGREVLDELGFGT